MKTSSNDLQRYDDNTRMNHWALALLFFCAGLSGLAFFHPSLYFFTGLFGGGTWTRILHPYFGVLMFLSFLGIYARLAKDNAWKASDREWLDKSGEMFKGNKDSMPPVGKYNAGQKIVFWIMTVSLVLLLVTGVLFWHAWFPNLPILARRVGVLLHAASAVALVLSVIVHIYAAIWVKGTTRAMTRGTVSRGWAQANHPLWYKDMTQGK
jgi:formate dehydrogenase subunit gamma